MPGEIPAAEYVRMSTEHQQYSTENQREIIRQYAEQRGMIIVRTYTDVGKSGLRIDGRDALKQLIGDVEKGCANFSAILVYDVSRWGRFQDADESAYYEYMNEAALSVQMIPIKQINVLNPRSRNKVTFQGIVSNISNLGLKKPITVARRLEATDGKPYDLVCGQGRLEAFVALGQTEILPRRTAARIRFGLSSGPLGDAVFQKSALA
jgi:hypothetical protein